jgi:SAM-dependent methyltransferase
MTQTYREIISHYERCLEQHGAGARAVDWKNETSAETRYDIALGLIPDDVEDGVVLDFGCGLAGLRDHMEIRGLGRHAYIGLEISEKFAVAARARRPDLRIETGDALASTQMHLPCDYLVMNGVFTRRQTLDEDAMMEYMQRLVSRVWPWVSRGLSFNVMSRAVDWHGEGLFHADPGLLVSWLGSSVSRHFVLRNDYGLHETTVYVYREPQHIANNRMRAR